MIAIIHADDVDVEFGCSPLLTCQRWPTDRCRRRRARRILHDDFEAGAVAVAAHQAAALAAQADGASIGAGERDGLAARMVGDAEPKLVVRADHHAIHAERIPRCGGVLHQRPAIRALSVRAEIHDEQLIEARRVKFAGAHMHAHHRLGETFRHDRDARRVAIGAGCDALDGIGWRLEWRPLWPVAVGVGLSDVERALLVHTHRHRVDDVRFGGDQADGETLGQHELALDGRGVGSGGGFRFGRLGRCLDHEQAKRRRAGEEQAQFAFQFQVSVHTYDERARGQRWPHALNQPGGIR